MLNHSLRLLPLDEESTSKKSYLLRAAEGEAVVGAAGVVGSDPAKAARAVVKEADDSAFGVK